jgi:hypothetical protein
VNLRCALSPADKTRHSVDLPLGKQAGSLAGLQRCRDDERVVQLVHPAGPIETAGMEGSQKLPKLPKYLGVGILGNTETPARAVQTQLR